MAAKVWPAWNCTPSAALPQNALPTLSVSSTAESGAYPLESPFPTQRMSGHTSACSAANQSPRRPKPVTISSKIRSTPVSSQRPRSARRYSAESACTPAVSITGSTMIAETVRGPSCAITSRSCARHPRVHEPVQARHEPGIGGCAWIPPERNGSYGVRSCGQPVDVSAPIVAPWYER